MFIYSWRVIERCKVLTITWNLNRPLLEQGLKVVFNESTWLSQKSFIVTSVKSHFLLECECECDFNIWFRQESLAVSESLRACPSRKLVFTQNVFGCWILLNNLRDHNDKAISHYWTTNSARRVTIKDKCFLILSFLINQQEEVIIFLC